MAPSKKDASGQDKAKEKAKAKVVEDKTFGLKNKNKSKSVQQYIRSVQAAVTGTRPKSENELKAEQKEKQEQRKRATQQAALLASLTKGRDALKAAEAANKDGNATNLPSQKIDLYVDQRTQKEKKDETVDDWDQSQLEQVIKTKHGGQKSAATEIVCKHFLDALDKRLYGWFWQCPNGGDSCQYRHCLPPGYVFAPKKKEFVDEDAEEEAIEDVIERERAALPAVGTPVTLALFMAWKEKQESLRVETQEKKKVERGEGEKTGREIFAFNPALFVDAEGAEDLSAELLNLQQKLDAGDGSDEDGEIVGKGDGDGENEDEDEENQEQDGKGASNSGDSKNGDRAKSDKKERPLGTTVPKVGVKDWGNDAAALAALAASKDTVATELAHSPKRTDQDSAGAGVVNEGVFRKLADDTNLDELSD